MRPVLRLVPAAAASPIARWVGLKAATSRRAAGALPMALGLLALHAGAAEVQVQVTDAAGRPLPEAVVFLESASAHAAVKPLQGVEIAQQKRRFVQPVTVVTVGSSVNFPNRDSVRHHVYSFSPAKNFEIKLYAGEPANPVTFDKAGVAVLGCNIHDQMVAWVLVLDTPYFARSAASGTALLADVPPGSYRLRSWHAELPVGAPALDQALVVAGGAATASVQFSAVAGADK